MPGDKCFTLSKPSPPRLPTLMNKLRIHERMCTPCSRWSVFANVYVDVKKNRSCTCIGAQDTCVGHATPTTNNCRYTRACAPGQQCSNYIRAARETIVNYPESCASILQDFGCRTLTCSQRHRPDNCSLKKTMQIHAIS